MKCDPTRKVRLNGQSHTYSPDFSGETPLFEQSHEEGARRMNLEILLANERIDIMCKQSAFPLVDSVISVGGKHPPYTVAAVEEKHYCIDGTLIHGRVWVRRRA